MPGKPLWRLLARMTPEQLVSLIDFRYLTDAITPERGLALLARRGAGRAERERQASRARLPRLHHPPGWLGYDEEKLAGSAKRRSSRRVQP